MVNAKTIKIGDNTYPIEDAGAVRIAQGAENLCKYVITDGNANVTVSDVLGIKIENFDDLKGYLERPRSLPLILNADITSTEQIRAATNVINLNGHNITSDGLSHRFAEIQNDQTVSIYGEGKISGFNFTEQGGCMVVHSGAKLKLNKVDFEDCKVSGENISSGCIRLDGATVEATDCTFKNCKSEGWVAGVAYIQIPGRFIGHNCTFDTCSAKNTGGVFYVNKSDTSTSTLELTDCSFSSCTAQGNGGGIYSSGTATITDCSFSSCTAQGNGGGIYSSGTATITDCSFSSCTAQGYGGGICSYGTATITDCSFSSCTAQGNGGGIGSYGTATITDCSFSSCTAKNGGGASFEGTATVTDCSFSSCTAQVNGGGIDISGNAESTWHTFKNITVFNCTSSRFAFINWGRAIINGVKIQNCYATTDAAGFGSNSTAELKLSGAVIITNNYLKASRIPANCLLNTNVELIGPLTGICDIKTSVSGGTPFGKASAGATTDDYLAFNFTNTHETSSGTVTMEGEIVEDGGEYILKWKEVTA